jgi:hypothetical protein
MNDSNICLKPIHKLLTDEQGKSTQFWIPAYQRGYRWKPLQVTQLLDDVREFILRRNPQPDEFYCLQPLVLKAATDGVYEVVDGQQRLTTLLLILRHFNERRAEKYRQTLFTLAYETRPALLGFLDDPTDELAGTNVDFFHLFEAITAIEKWFSNKENEVDDIKSALLNKTKVIWFELSQKDNAVDAFTRLNVGKIPLTNDELIRALFLRRLDAKESDAAALQLKIAHEWDQLEKALQSDAFWYFLSNQPGQRQNRIGFLFELVAKADGLPEGFAHDAYGIFYAYSKKLKDDGAAPKDEWLRIKQTFMMLEEWFEDRTLYHIVGFLIQQGSAVDKICALSAQATKSSFEQKLRAKVFEKVIGDERLEDLNEVGIRERVTECLEALEYGRDSGRIRSILLLFNLATLLDNPRSNLRFQFDSFKRENWDIEHVRSVASSRPIRPHDRVAWMKLCLGYLNTQVLEVELCGDLEKFITLSPKDSEAIFEPLYKRVLAVFNETDDEEVSDGISNLTLLDQNTNRSYKNAVFAVKRDKLLSLDQSGIFVPLCTRNVFLKCYGPQVDNVMFWGEEDRAAYQRVMIDTLVGFFSGKTEVRV